MIVRKMESPVFQQKKRQPLPGRGAEHVANEEKSFDQYLLEAFQGEVVKEGERFHDSLSPLQKENVVRLSRL